ncbi:MAG TPA: DUF892 family protein [Opitutales bacterium]|nr:DUF892 family protein [Opitutales bacterium]
MKIDTLEALYQDQMAAVRNGQEQLQELFPELLSVITHFELRNLIRESMGELREQIGRIERFMPENMITRQGNESAGMRGLIEECHAFFERATDPEIIDIGIVVAYGKMLQVMMGSHASLQTLAIFLSRAEEAEAFKRSLEELAATEKKLHRLMLDIIDLDSTTRAA